MGATETGILQTMAGLSQGFLVWWILAALVGAAFAFMKGRNFFLWGVGCFVFPILLVVVMRMPKIDRA